MIFFLGGRLSSYGLLKSYRQAPCVIHHLISSRAYNISCHRQVPHKCLMNEWSLSHILQPFLLENRLGLLAGERCQGGHPSKNVVMAVLESEFLLVLGCHKEQKHGALQKSWEKDYFHVTSVGLTQLFTQLNCWLDCFFTFYALLISNWDPEHGQTTFF